MKKAIKILLLISGVCTIISGIWFLLAGIQSESNMTFDDILNKYYAEGYRGDDLWKILK